MISGGNETNMRGDLTDSLCDKLNFVGSLTGDDLLDISGNTFGKDHNFWPVRGFLRSHRNTNRANIIDALYSLRVQTHQWLNVLSESYYLHVENVSIHPLVYDKIQIRISQIEKISGALENHARGLEAQRIHYHKLQDDDTRRGFEKLENDLQNVRDWIRPILHHLKNRFPRTLILPPDTEHMPCLSEYRMVRSSTLVPLPPQQPPTVTSHVTPLPYDIK